MLTLFIIAYATWNTMKAYCLSQQTASKVFDDAFLSRVHVALNFTELSQEAKEQIWRAFIKKMGSSAGGY